MRDWTRDEKLQYLREREQEVGIVRVAVEGRPESGFGPCQELGIVRRQLRQRQSLNAKALRAGILSIF